MSLEEAQNLVMTARVMLGWVDPTEMAAAESGDEAEADQEAEA
jgi:N utilization substance protein A